LMRATVLRGGRMVLREDVPEPEPGPGQVLVAVKACGICGSDLHLAKHGDEVMAADEQMLGAPSLTASVDLDRDVFMGHEFAAEVLEAGPDTESLPSGTIVTSMPALVSPEGMANIVCSNSTMGAYAERMLLSAPLLLPVPNGLDPRHAALTEPMAVGLHAVNKSGIERNEVALVLGCGPVGIAIVAALRRQGVETIVAADYSAKRRDLAETMGAGQTVDPAECSPFDDVTPAVVFEAVGVPGVLDDVLRRAPMGTRIIVAGVCMQPDVVHPFWGIMKELSIQFALGYDPTEFASSLHAIAEGLTDVTPMITGEVGLDGVAAAFDELSDPNRHCKIVVTP
jgi:2-desacetyl-2-hydroxyethyl bacteriochlorophyllide A dehydrogenase